MKKRSECTKLNFLIFVLIFTGLFISCVYDDEEIAPTKKYSEIRHLFLELANYNQTGECSVKNPQKYFFSPSAEKLMKTRIIMRTQNITVLEMLNPNYSGKAESGGFYSGEMDAGLWLEKILTQIEEEKYAEQMEETLSLELEMDSPLPASEPPKIPGGDESKVQPDSDTSEDATKSDDSSRQDKAETEVETVEKRLLDSKERLSRLSFGEEIFIPSKTPNQTVLINSQGNRVFRNFYDDRSRLFKREFWSIKGADNSKIEKTETYGFYGDSLSPVSKSIETEKELIKSTYNTDGKATVSEVYKKTIVKSTVKKEVKKSTENDTKSGGNAGEKSTSKNEETEIITETIETPVAYLESKTEWTYSKEGKILSETFTGYEYKKEKYEKHADTFTKKQVFAYHEDDEIPPDYEYFEDGELRMKTIYTAKSSWVTETRFDGGYTIITKFEENKRIRETFIQDGKTIRIKNYE